MNLKKWIKTFLALIAISLIATVIPVTFSNNTQSEEYQQEFQATQAKLVNFLMHLYETLNDFDEESFNEELLEILQVEIKLALTVAQRSTSVATIEYSLGFLRIAYSSLLENAIEDEIDAIESLVYELNALNEEDFAAISWIVLQEQLENVEGVIDDILQELDELGIEFDNDSNEDEEQDARLEVSVRELPDLTPYLRECFDTLIEIHEALISTYNALDVSGIAADEIEASESDNNINVINDSEEQEYYCPRNDDECLIALFQVTRFELHNLLIYLNENIQNVDDSYFESELWNELQVSMHNAIEALTSDDIEEMTLALELLETVSLELR